MPEATVRPFRRADRDQLTSLVNTHLAALLPGLSVSVNTVLNQLEREPGEFVVDPWVVERATLVAELRGRIVAAAHLLRYGGGDEVGPHYRDTAELRWLIFYPGPSDQPSPDWQAGTSAAGSAVLATALEQLRRWRPRSIHANGSLPAPAAYGVPDVWPHVTALLRERGFAPGRRELIAMIEVADLDRVGPPWPGLRVERSVGSAGTRLTAVGPGGDGEVRHGYVEVEAGLGDPGRFRSGAGLADIGNLWVEPSVRRRGVGRWLLAEAARWLQLGGVGLLLTYSDEASGGPERAFDDAVGFQPLTWTTRGWTYPG